MQPVGDNRLQAFFDMLKLPLRGGSLPNTQSYMVNEQIVNESMAIVKWNSAIDYVKGALSKPKKQNGHSHGDYLIGTHREAATTNPNCTRTARLPPPTRTAHVRTSKVRTPTTARHLSPAMSAHSVPASGLSARLWHYAARIWLR